MSTPAIEAVARAQYEAQIKLPRDMPDIERRRALAKAAYLASLRTIRGRTDLWDDWEPGDSMWESAMAKLIAEAKG